MDRTIIYSLLSTKRAISVDRTRTITSTARKKALTVINSSTAKKIQDFLAGVVNLALESH